MKIKKLISLELSRGLYESQTCAHPLRQLFWECTLRCNFACRHCGSDCKVSSEQKDMPFDDFKKVLENIKRHVNPGFVSIIISGGEPLSRKDIEQCGLEIYRMGFPWGMVTNAWGLSRERFVSLLKSGIHSMTISLDGIGEDHDWMRGRVGAFQRASDAIGMVCAFNKACRDGQDALGFTGLKPSDALAFDVVTCVNKRNIGKLEQIKEHLLALGLESWRLFTIFPVGRAADDLELQLDSAEFRSLMEFIKATRKEGCIKASYACEGFVGEYEGEVRDNFYYCNAGRTVASVLSDGSISACLSIRSDYHQGNIYKDDFWQVWEKGFAQYRDRSWMKTGECAECKYWRFCQGNGMHLRDSEGKLILCNLKKLQ